jgi:hypothetical protein
MRRLPIPSAEDGSSPVETLLLAALAVVLAAAVVGVALMVTLEPRIAPDPTDPALATGSPVAAVPVLEIACGADAASIGGEAVDANSSGVPVKISGDDGAALSFASPGIPGYRMQLFEPSGEYALPLPPGPWVVSCVGSDALSGPATLGTFEVRDPGRVYLRTSPDCPASGCCDEVVGLSPGFVDDELGVLHDGLAGTGVLPTDTIERAAYARSRLTAQPPNPLVYRVVRNLQIVARLDVARADGTWSALVFGCPAA